MRLPSKGIGLLLKSNSGSCIIWGCTSSRTAFDGPADTEFQVQDCNFCEGNWVKNNKKWCLRYGDDLKLFTLYKWTTTKEASTNLREAERRCPSKHIHVNCTGTCNDYPASDRDQIEFSSASGCDADENSVCNWAVSTLNAPGWTPSNPKLTPRTWAEDKSCWSTFADEKT